MAKIEQIRVDVKIKEESTNGEVGWAVAFEAGSGE